MMLTETSCFMKVVFSQMTVSNKLMFINSKGKYDELVCLAPYNCLFSVNSPNSYLASSYLITEYNELD